MEVATLFAHKLCTNYHTQRRHIQRDTFNGDKFNGDTQPSPRYAYAIFLS